MRINMGNSPSLVAEELSLVLGSEFDIARYRVCAFLLRVIFIISNCKPDYSYKYVVLFNKELGVLIYYVDLVIIVVHSKPITVNVPKEIGVHKLIYVAIWEAEKLICKVARAKRVF